MTEAFPAPSEPLSVTPALVTLVGSAVLALGGALFLRGSALQVVCGVSGFAATLGLALFATRRAERAERGARLADVGSGRIVERGDAERVSLELPADGLEPWGLDAWVVGVTALALTFAGTSARALFAVFFAILCMALAARLWVMAKDRIRIELSRGGFLVEAVGANRSIQRAGKGAIWPALEPDALILWTQAGRLGVLRGELTPKERAWLAERLSALAVKFGSPARSAGEQVDQREAHEHRQCEQGEHAD